MKVFSRSFWPYSLKGQVLLSLALALLLAQSISAALLYRAQTEHRREAIIRNVAVRLSVAMRHQQESEPDRAPAPNDPLSRQRAEQVANFAANPGDRRLAPIEHELREILSEQDIPVTGLQIYQRPLAADPQGQARLAKRNAIFHRGPSHESNRGPPPSHVVIAGLQRQSGGDWLVVRVLEPPREPMLLITLIGQTLLIYAVLVGAMALILRRITRPLALLTNRLDLFGDTSKPFEPRHQPLAQQGPQDMRRLILAHNTMEARILALLDEKDVMLGAIGHDLKTPLASLRVRIEQVEDDSERARMAATIEDIVRTLDDILSLARVGRPSDPLEQTELSALVGSVVDEFEDMGEPVTISDTTRIATPIRATWLRRALRNLIGNGLRYGNQVRVTLARETLANRQWAAIAINDDGAGIPEDQIAQMLQPFKRGDPSRNKGTGGSGLGLTLALAIAEQHGGTLTLANRRAEDGQVMGLTATLRLPIG